jgi:hypothetical protein
VRIELESTDLKPLVAAIVAEALQAIDSGGDGDGRLAYSEAEAAELLGIGRHVLRDVRLAGKITATKAGGRIAYERGELLAYLARNRQEGKA